MIEFLSDAPLEGMNREELKKFTFLFGDSILISEKSLFKDECKWLHQVGDMKMLVWEMWRSCSLTNLQSISIPHQMK